jgi:hypothetical protein
MDNNGNQYTPAQSHCGCANAPVGERYKKMVNVSVGIVYPRRKNFNRPLGPGLRNMFVER